MKILLVDDNKTITMMFAEYFKLMGQDVSVSNDGQSALQRIENENFDVILLDLAMPGFSGRDIIDHLYDNGKIRNKTIVFLTAMYITDDDKNYLVDRGAYSVLSKPINPSELLNYVKKIKSHG